MKYSLDTFRGDLFGGLTSTVVALPVALGFGIASGMGAAAGLHGAIAVGFFASAFGGTRSQISGPTAPMTVVMAVVITSHTTSLAEALTVVVMAGLLQILLGLSRIGRFVAYTPYVVVSGFMSGVGIIIMLMQILPALGAPIAPGADALGKLMPSAGHLVHMPAHIYIRVGRHDDAVTSNQRAIEADLDYIAQCNAQGLYPVAYYPHNIHFLWAAATFGGRSALAIETADNLAQEVPAEMAAGLAFLQNYLATPLFARIRFGRWDEIRRTPQPPAGQAFQNAMWHYARGLAAAATGRTGQARRHLKALGRLGRDPELADIRISFASATDLARLAEHLVAGEIHASKGRSGRAIEEMRAAVTLQDNLRYAEPPAFHYPVRQSLGAVLLDADQAAEAEAVYRQDLEHNPHNGWSLFGLAMALADQGRDDEAAEVRERFEAAWKTADVELEASVFR